MVQLPATAAIEYVAAWHFSPGVFWPGALLAGGIFVREGFRPGGLLYGGSFARGGLLSGGLMPVPPKFNAYTNRLGFLCRSVTDKQKQQTKKQTNSAS